MVTLGGFSVRYPGFTLGPLDVALGTGERVALVGPNGAGKSTTLSAMAGRLRDYGGSLRLAGVEVRTDAAKVREGVGVLPESLLGFGWMTVEEHLSFLKAFFPAWDADYARELCGRLDVPRSSLLANLSKGTRVKVSLVAAEAHRPPLLLLDEPTSGIDPLMRGRLLDVLDECLPSGGERTLVFSTHILEDLDRIADRILLLKEGRLVADAGVAELARESGGGSLSAIVGRRLADA